MVPRRRRWLTAVGVLGAAMLGLTLAVAARAPVLLTLDRLGHGDARSDRDATTTALARLVTWGGDARVAGVVVLVATLVLAGRRGWRVAPAVLVGAVLLLLSRTALADGLGRLRPPRVDWVGGASGFAFPSGHTTAATMAGVLLALAVGLRTRRRAVAGAAWLVGAAYSVAVGWSRVWLGVHWPTDVLGGWLLGSVCALLLLAVALEVRGSPEPAPSSADSPGR